MDMSQPIFPAPDGYVVDLANPQRTGVAASFWIGTVGMILAFILIATRTYTKIVFAKSFSPDDGILLVAWLLSIAVQGIMLFQYGRGTLGTHIWEMTGERVNSMLNLVTITTALYCAFLACAKLSLLLFYLRLSPIPWFRAWVYVSMFIVVSSNVGPMFSLLFSCTPVKKNWNISISEGSCTDRTPSFIATAVLNMITDIWLLVLPIPMIASLQMSRSRKLGIICVFGVGSITCITSGVRLILLFPMLKNPDLSWATVTPAIWIFIEANLVIVTGSLPTMRLFLRHVAPTWGGDSVSQKSRSREKCSKCNHSSSNRSELQTIGSKGTKKKQYDTFHDEVDTIGSEERTHASWRDDQDSERGIMSQRINPEITITREVVVKNEPKA